MHKNKFILAIFLFVATLFTQNISAQNLPDLVINQITTDNKNRLAISVKNVGSGNLPNSVWTNKNPKSPSITFTVNGRNWGGRAIWSFDSKQNLKKPGGRVLYLTNYTLKGDVKVTATVDRFNQVRESNERNNSLTRTVKFLKRNSAQKPTFSSRGTYLNTASSFDNRKINTMNTMQQHVQWVSETNISDVKKGLERSGFILLGDVISAAGFKGTRLRAYVATKGNDVVVVFRGTGAGKGKGGQTAANAIVTDANVLMKTPSFFYRSSRLTKDQKDSLVHKGFDIAYGKMRSQIIRAVINQRGKNIYAFGHSLGGALATLFALDIAINHKSRFRSITHIVSGSPRVGNLKFAQTFGRKVPNNLRIVLNGDPIPTIPRRAGVRAKKKYVHVGRLIVLNLSGIMVEPKNIKTFTNWVKFPIYHDNKNYQESVAWLLISTKQMPGLVSSKGGTQLIIDSANAERN